MRNINFILFHFFELKNRDKSYLSLIEKKRH